MHESAQTVSAISGDQQAEFDLFLSYNRRDQTVVERLAQALRDRGLRVFKDDWYLHPGHYWPTALQQKLAGSKAIAVAIGRDGLGPWQQREAVAALDRQDQAAKAGDPIPPVIPLLLEEGSDRQAGLAFLLQNTWVECWDPRAPDLIDGAVRNKAPAELYDQDHTDPRTLICPYRGLEVFREEDAAFYFGREQDLDHLEAAVDRQPLVAIVGPSGSGKSSLARAGLIARLRRAAGAQVWQMAQMVPGREPFLALARELLPLREPERVLTWPKASIDEECERLAHRLEQNGADHLSHVLSQILKEEPGTTNLLLLVDQWEELYTYRPADADAAARQRARGFVGMLLEAVREGILQVVLTLRADYWGEVLNDPPLAARLPDKAIVHLRSLDRAALEMIIRRPADTTGLIVPDALAEILLNDASGQPGDLPLIEFALQHLWFERVGNALTLDAYHRMGGLEKAIVSRAEAVYDRLDPREREAVPGVFAALVQLGEERSDLRRRGRLVELSEAGQAVARRLAGERLLVTSRDWRSGDDLVEVAHEALLRHWPKLSEWIDARRSALLTIRQLQADTRTWLGKGRSASYSWSHERVREAVLALSQLDRELVLDDDERAFLGPVDFGAMLLELQRPETSHHRRALIGERLDALGDPRRGIGVDADGTPDIDWCHVPGGEVAIRVERRILGGTKPQTKPIASFQIARYPITVVQYRAFLEAEDGWRDSRFWAGDLYRDFDGDSYDVGRFGNHPAVYVSWFDAVAFCRWFSQRLGFTIGLPDEWQWQQAATGGRVENVFPWGLAWHPKDEPHRANTFESRLGGTIAVGMYPSGASPVGALDMTGSIWEWSLNKYDYPYATEAHDNDFDDRALRGGAYFNSVGFVGCAKRFKNSPVSRNNGFGFRVMSSSPQQAQ